MEKNIVKNIKGLKLWTLIVGIMAFVLFVKAIASTLSGGLKIEIDKNPYLGEKSITNTIS